ncbi:hypothetical protein ARMGADRAFT_781906 [Armillaria gallica]|uniref:Uncharacterized protein n=1 Tax=Armillaria gallica TaxID=47427 RepID=A0A2H3CJ13_ARMGA|nr:hypothetical protein ARMGADRAFT_781906 [Armillaria gallica]
MCLLPWSTSMGISDLLAFIKTSKSLLMQAVISELDERHPSSLGGILSCSDWTTWKDVTRRVDSPEIHTVSSGFSTPGEILYHHAGFLFCCNTVEFEDHASRGMGGGTRTARPERMCLDVIRVKCAHIHL